MKLQKICIDTSRLDLLVSWNFKHIVNIKRIRGYNGINIKNGYPSIEIRSPQDLIDYENDSRLRLCKNDAGNSR